MRHLKAAPTLSSPNRPCLHGSQGSRGPAPEQSCLHTLHFIWRLGFFIPFQGLWLVIIQPLASEFINASGFVFPFVS